MTSTFKQIPLIILMWIQNVISLDPLVQSKVGLIKGLRAPDGDYSMFLGIPYAKVNETNPFGPSISYPNFDTAYEAYDDSSLCPQVEEFSNTIVGTLDCLHLNIFVPSTASSRNRVPVLVSIHGGGFAIGSHRRDLNGPKFLVRHNIIVVTLTYRLGPYGFMCVNNPDVLGNQGLKDQLKALHWISDNIEAFGGDVNKITVYGESAGGISIDLHLLSDEKKLFNQAIFSSGVAFLRPLNNPNEEVPLKLAEHLGVVTNNSDEALSFLSTVDPKLIIAATSATGVQLWPCVEQKLDNMNNFLTEQPVNLDVPKVRDMRILVGYNNKELLGPYEMAFMFYPSFYDNLDVINEQLRSFFDFDQKRHGEMEEIVRHFYLGDEKMRESVKSEIIDFTSDIVFLHPTHRTINKFAENKAENMFLYVFSYSGKRNFFNSRLNITLDDASHADELGYIFDMAHMTDEPNTEDQLVIDRITTIWANFVKYGNPTPEVTELLPVNWEPVTRDVLNYANIDLSFTTGKRPFSKRMAFWDLFYKLNEKYQTGYKENN